MWVKGQSGNPGGSEKQKLFRRALRDVLTYDRAKKIAEKVVQKAEDGDLWAANMVADRLDGKPKQEIDISDERSSNLAERFEEILLSAARTADAVHPARGEGGTSRVN